MTSAPARKSDWLTPQNLFGVLGMLGMAFGSYQAFQKDTRDELGGLKTEIAVLKVKVEGCAR